MRCPAPQSTSGQSFQQRPSLHEVRRREPFRVGAVDGRQRGAGVGAAALPLPQTGETHGGPQLPPFALLAQSRLGGPAEAVFGGGNLVGRLGQQQLALEAMQLGLVATVIVLLGDRQPFVQRLVRILKARGLRVGIAQHAEVRRNPHFRPGGPEGTKPLEEKWQRFLAPALQEHPRPLVERA